MDTLSRLLSLYPLKTAMDVRCHFGAPWVLDHGGSKAGIAPYHLLLDGTARLLGEHGQELDLQPGDVIVFPHGDAHRLYTGDPEQAPPPRPLPGEHPVALIGNEGEGAVSNLLCGEFRFQSGSADALLRALPPILIVRTAGRPELANLRALIALLEAETDTLRPGSSAILGQLASALFALLLRASIEHAEVVPGVFGVLAERRLQAALEAMLSAPQQPWTLALLAASCHMSRATFARLFRRAAGMPPAEMLTQLRMQLAAQQLLKGETAAGQVADMVGYQSEAAFSRVFKRYHGIGPGQYRRQAGAEP